MKMRKLLCLVLSLLLVLSLAACGEKEKKGNSYKDVVEKYMDAMADANYAKIMKLAPKKVIENIKEDREMDEDDWEAWLEKNSTAMTDRYATWEEYYGGEVMLSYEITDTWDMDEDALADIQEEYEDKYDIKVKAGKVVEVEVTLNLDGKKEDSAIMEVIVLKVADSWYLELFESDYLFH